MSVDVAIAVLLRCVTVWLFLFVCFQPQEAYGPLEMDNALATVRGLDQGDVDNAIRAVGESSKRLQADAVSKILTEPAVIHEHQETNRCYRECRKWT